MGGLRCLGLFPKKNRFFWMPSLSKDVGNNDTYLHGVCTCFEDCAAAVSACILSASTNGQLDYHEYLINCTSWRIKLKMTFKDLLIWTNSNIAYLD